jgi:hypothetical protein
MSDFKTKFPDFKEISSIANKLLGDIKKSVCEIMDNYKTKREEPSHKKAEAGEVVSSSTKTRKKPAAKKTSKPRAKKKTEE